MRRIITTLLVGTLACTVIGCQTNETANETTEFKAMEVSETNTEIDDAFSSTELPLYESYSETEDNELSDDDIVEHLLEVIEAQKNLAISVEDSLMNEDLTQSEMNKLSSQLYEIWDTALNMEWDVLKQILDDDSMNKLLIEQREWITYKENEIQKVVEESGGGSITPLAANQRAASLTKSRVYELLDYITY